MNVSGQDINQTLEYRSATVIVRLLPTGLLLVFLGLLIFALVVDPDREEVSTNVGVVLCLMVGVALAGFTLWRRANPGKPLFTLSPDGIHYRIPLVKEVLIPWQEIQGVDTIDIEAGYWSFLWFTRFPTPRYNTWVAREVTVILLPRPFYDRRIFVDSPFLRGRLECQLHSQGFADPDGFAPRTRLSRTAGAARSGRGALACISRKARRRAGANERTRCVGSEPF